MTLTLCGPALPQVAFADFLSSGGYDAHLRRIRRAFADNIARMTRAIDRAFPPGTRVTRPAGGFVLWLELPKGIKTRPLLEEALTHGICFAPGDVFSASNRYANCLRLSCGHHWDARIEAAVERLGALAGTTSSGSGLMNRPLS
jgi:DNA-binding transcriptional MocR family regulator